MSVPPKHADHLVVGGGISGLSLAYFLSSSIAAQNASRKVLLLEKASRVGGTVRTINEDGFVCEAGPNGFLDNRPKTVELATSVDLQDSILKSNDRSRIRYIYHSGKFHKLPTSIKEFISSDLLSIPGRLRVAAEPFTKPAAASDETVADFGRRHIGQEAVDHMIDPFISGVFAGDPEKLSLKSIMPKMAAMDKEYGSLIKAMFSMQKKKKQMEKETGKKMPSASPFGGGVLTSFIPGLSELTDALGRSAGYETLKDANVTGISTRTQEDGQLIYEVSYDIQGKAAQVTAEKVFLATPAYVSSEILRNLLPGVSETLSQIPYAPAAVLCFGFNKAEFDFDLNGFGFLIPHREERKILGSVWASSVFDGRAPEGHVLLQVVAGGACDHQTPMLPDDQLISTALDELRDIMGFTAEPVLTKLFKYEKAIPQYNVGHSEILDRLSAGLAGHPGLYLTGNAYHGVGLNDCIENSFKLAQEVLAT